MATVGQQLITPESGWKRYDDTDSRISYDTNWAARTNYSGYYNSTEKGCSVNNSKAKFKFYGSKIRIINQTASNLTPIGNVTIDGINYIFSEYNASANPTQILVFEKNDLKFEYHTVEIFTTDGNMIQIDAIDIDDAGYLLHPILNEVHSLSDIKSIGDCIPCRYTALTSGQVGIFSELGTTLALPMPTTSSATPDGSFYWVYIGKDYLGRKKFVADRNIQNNISWDTLNAAGICSEIATFNRANPIMSSNTTKGLAKAGSIYNSSYDAYKAFNGIEKQTSDCWGTAYNIDSSSAWLSYSFENSIVIDSYYMSMPTRTDSAAAAKPTSWKLEATNDDNTWVTLDTRDSIVWDTTGNRIYFKFNNGQAYKTYRITITKVQSGLPPFTYGAIIGELIFIEKINNNYKSSIRLLTGGTSATDTDNEWDKIIVSSTLGGKITASDNNVWNWNGISSMTSTISTTGNTYRIARGYSAANASISNVSTTSATTVGFRPVLLVETLMTYKYLLRKDSKYYNLKQESYDNTNNIFIPLTLEGNTIPNENDINNFGLNDLSQFTTQMTIGGNTFMPIDKFKDNFEVLLYYK